MEIRSFCIFIQTDIDEMALNICAKLQFVTSAYQFNVFLMNE